MTEYTVAVDDTVAGWRAVEWAADNVDRATDTVRLLTVNEFYGESPTRSEHRLEAAEQQLLDAQPGLAIVHDVTDGPTADRLVLDAGHGDVLVIGAQQLHTITAALTGRIAERVVAHATTPVVVVPEEWERSDGPVVVGVDGRTAAAALAWAASTAERIVRDLHLVRAWAVPTAMAPYANIYLEEDRVLWSNAADIELQAALHAVKNEHQSLQLAAESVEGQARDVVLQAARGASLVVVGRRHRTALGGFLTGSVGETLMHRGHTPVCIVPQPRRTTVRDELADDHHAVKVE